MISIPFGPSSPAPKVLSALICTRSASLAPSTYRSSPLYATFTLRVASSRTTIVGQHLRGRGPSQPAQLLAVCAELARGQTCSRANRHPSHPPIHLEMHLDRRHPSNSRVSSWRSCRSSLPSLALVALPRGTHLGGDDADGSFAPRHREELMDIDRAAWRRGATVGWADLELDMSFPGSDTAASRTRRVEVGLRKSEEEDFIGDDAA